MPVTADSVIVELEAKIADYKRKMNEAAQVTEKTTRKGSRDFKRMEDDIRNSSNEISGTLKRLAGTFAAAFSVREIIRVTDSFTRLQNNLRVAGQEGASLAKVQGNLLDISQRYGVNIETLSNVFLKASLAQKELGASTAEIIQLNEVVAASLKITGTSAEQARGALLQLGQALGSDIVRGEEFNSLLENALPVVQAAARGIDRFGGSVARLRAEVVDGKVTSQEFFQGILAGGIKTIADAEKATLTLSGAFEALSSAFTVYVGEANKTNGATTALATAIKTLADNLDALIPILATVALGLGVGYVQRLAAARLATITLGTAARATGGALLAAFGGPIGLAITGVAVGLGYLASESAKAEAEAAELQATADTLAAKLGTLKTEAEKAKSEFEEMTPAQLAAEAAATGLIVTVGQLADEQTRLAVETRQANLALLEQATLNSRKDALEDFRGYLAKKDRAGGSPGSRAAASRRNADRGMVLGNEYASSNPNDPANREWLRRQDSFQTYVQNRRTEKAYRSRSLTDLIGDVTPESSGAASSGGGKPKKAGRAAVNNAARDAQRHAREAERRARELDREEQQIADDAARDATERRRLQAEELQARRDIATTAEERSEIDRDLLDLESEQRRSDLDREFAQRAREINDSEVLSDERKQQALEDLREEKNAQKAYLDKLYGIRGVDESGEIPVGPPGLFQQAQRQQEERELAQLTMRELVAQRDVLDARIGITTNLGERKKLEREALAIDHRLETMALEQEIAEGRILDAEKARALLLETQLAEQQALAKVQQGPLAKYRDSIAETKENIGYELEDIQVRGFEALNDGLVEAIMNSKSLGEVFTQVTNQIIKDLLRIAVQQLIIQPLLNALGTGVGGGGGSGAGGAIGGAGSSILGAIGARAGGGQVMGKQAYLVGERGPELFAPAGSGKIYPTGSLKLSDAGKKAGSTQVIQVDARGAVMNDEFARNILARAEQMDRQTGAAVFKKAVEAAPQGVSKQSRYG